MKSHDECPPIKSTEKDVLLNDFAIRSFRNIADYDYIAARMAYRTRLIPQFLWSGLQAIEKYLKSILLFNRIVAKNVKHNLLAAINLIEKEAPFKLQLRDSSIQLIDYLDTYGRFRYLEAPIYIRGLELPQLDFTVWDIRRYCQLLNYEVWDADGNVIAMLMHEIRVIENSTNRPPQHFHLHGGEIEKILKNKKHPARKELVWQNLCFGQVPRKRVSLARSFHAINPPLSLHPEILDDVIKYIFLPKDVIAAYRAAQEKQK